MSSYRYTRPTSSWRGSQVPASRRASLGGGTAVQPLPGGAASLNAQAGAQAGAATTSTISNRAKSKLTLPDKTEVKKLKSATDSASRKLDAAQRLLNTGIPQSPASLISSPRGGQLAHPILNLPASDPRVTLGGLSKNYKVPSGTGLQRTAQDVAQTLSKPAVNYGLTGLKTLATGKSPTSIATGTVTGLTGAARELNLPGAKSLDRFARSGADKINTSIEKHVTGPISKAVGKVPVVGSSIKFADKRIDDTLAATRTRAPYNPVIPSRQEWTTQADLLAKAQEYRDEIAKHSAEIEKGDDRYGFLNARSRKDAIAEAQSKLDNLTAKTSAMHGEDFLAKKYGGVLDEAASRGAVLPRISPEMQKAWDNRNRDIIPYSETQGDVPLDSQGVPMVLDKRYNPNMPEGKAYLKQPEKNWVWRRRSNPVQNPIVNPEVQPSASGTKQAGLATSDAQGRLNVANTLIDKSNATGLELKRLIEEDIANNKNLYDSIQKQAALLNSDPSARTPQAIKEFNDAKALYSQNQKAINQQYSGFQKAKQSHSQSKDFQTGRQQGRYDATTAQRLAFLNDIATNVNAPISDRTAAIRSMEGLLHRLQRAGVDVTPEYAAYANAASTIADAMSAPSPAQSIADAPGKVVEALNPGQAVHSAQSGLFTLVGGPTVGRKMANSKFNPLNLLGKGLDFLWKGPEAIARAPGTITHNIRGQNLDVDGDGIPDRTANPGLGSALARSVGAGGYTPTARTVAKKQEAANHNEKVAFVKNSLTPRRTSNYLMAREDGLSAESAAFLSQPGVKPGLQGPGTYEFQGEVYNITPGATFHNGKPKSARHQILEQQGWSVDPRVGTNGTWTPPGYEYKENHFGELELAKTHKDPNDPMSYYSEPIFRHDHRWTQPPVAPNWARKPAAAPEGAEDFHRKSGGVVKGWSSEGMMGGAYAAPPPKHETVTVGHQGPRGHRGVEGPAGQLHVAKPGRPLTPQQMRENRRMHHKPTKFGDAVGGLVETGARMAADRVALPLKAVVHGVSHPINTGRNLFQRGKRTVRDAARLPVTVGRAARGLATKNLKPRTGDDLVRQARSVASALDPFGMALDTAANPGDEFMRQVEDEQNERRRRAIGMRPGLKDTPSPQPNIGGVTIGRR